MGLWTALRVLAFALTPVWVFAVAWGVLRAATARRSEAGQRATAARERARRPVTVTLPAEPVDPFRTLALQYRLGALARELDDLAVDDGRVYARGLRLTAVNAAYDDVLEDACRLAGIPLQRDGQNRREVRRVMAESALKSAGWTW